MEDFVGTKVCISSAKDFELEGINNSTDSVEDSADKKPEESGMREDIPQSSEYT